MSEFGNLMSQYATPEVMTVVAAAFVLFLGWKIAGGVLGTIGSFTRKMSFAGLSSGLLVLAGLGGMGLGVGELGTRWEVPQSDTLSNGVPHVGFTNEELMELSTAENLNDDFARLALEYARTRDGHIGELSETEVLKLMAANADKPETISAITELWNARHSRLDEQYARLTEVPEPAPVVNEKPTYAPTVKESPSQLALYEAAGLLPEDGESDFDIIAVEEAEVGNPDSMMSLPMAFLALLMGAGSTIAGVVGWSSRNERRNPDDAHTMRV